MSTLMSRQDLKGARAGRGARRGEKGRRAEPAAQGGEMDELLATLSHELRTPTTAILGWAELISERRCDGDMFERGMEVIRRNARLQERLIGQLLDFARAGTSHSKLRPRSTPLAPVVVASVETVMPLARNKSVEVRSRIEFAEAAVSGEAELLQQVFVNLLSNAVKFAPESGHVEARLSRGGAACAEVAVGDDGPGIAADFLPHVFEPFRQADAVRLAGRGGLGLGLAIARKLVEMHGGEIGARSGGEGLGSTFTVRLPLEGRTRV